MKARSHKRVHVWKREPSGAYKEDGMDTPKPESARPKVALWLSVAAQLVRLVREVIDLIYALNG